jgi:hypothetical protein
MTDLAPQVAAYLVERWDDGAGPNALWHELQQRWPGLTREEATRGAQIAAELMAATIAEGAEMPLGVVSDALQALLRGDPLPPTDHQPEEDDHADRDR